MNLVNNQGRTKKVKVFFDGQCIVCAKEIEMYEKKDVSKLINFIDISSSNFNSAAEGLDYETVQKIFHVKNTNDQIITGVDAFVVIWETLGIFKPLAYLAKSSVVRPIFDLGYYFFSKIRPYLPRKNCDDGTCNF